MSARVVPKRTPETLPKEEDNNKEKRSAEQHHIRLRTSHSAADPLAQESDPESALVWRPPGRLPNDVLEEVHHADERIYRKT